MLCRPAFSALSGDRLPDESVESLGCPAIAARSPRARRRPAAMSSAAEQRACRATAGMPISDLVVLVRTVSSPRANAGLQQQRMISFPVLFDRRLKDSGPRDLRPGPPDRPGQIVTSANGEG